MGDKREVENTLGIYDTTITSDKGNEDDLTAGMNDEDISTVQPTNLGADVSLRDSVTLKDSIKEKAQRGIYNNPFN